MRSMEASQALTVPWREAFWGSTLLTMHSSERRGAAKGAQGLSENTLGTAFGVQLRGVEQAIADFECTGNGGNLALACPRRGPHHPGAKSEPPWEMQHLGRCVHRRSCDPRSHP